MSLNMQNATPVRINSEVNPANRAGEISDSIARRAYELFEVDGRMPGRDLDHWYRAQADLVHPSHLEVEEANDSIAIRVEVPGFAADQLHVHLDPRRLTITGRRETQHERTRGRVIYADHCADQIYRAVDLPAQVDVSRATANLRDGILQLELPKTSEARLSRAATQAS